MKKGIFVKLAGYEEDSWKSEFEFAKKISCDCVEFVLDYPLLGPSIYKKEILERIRKMAGDLEIILHLMPHRYNQVPKLKGRIFDLASLDENIREFSIEEVKKSFEMAEQLDSQIVTIHGGFCRDEKFYKENLEKLRDSLERINKFNDAVKLCIENLPARDHFWNKVDEIPKSPEELNLLVKNLDNIGITFDTGHANTIIPPIDFFNKLEKVWNIHAHDNKGNKDDHLSLGKGNIDFKDLIKELKEKNYQGYLTLELDINWEEEKTKKFPSKEQRMESWEHLQKIA